MILKGYFDDSGSHAQAPVYVLAGFLSSTEAWADFSDAWRAELDRPRPCGGKGICYFKANEAHRLKFEFKDWSEPDRDARVLALADVIAKYATHRVCAHMPRSMFDAAMVRYRAAMERYVPAGVKAEKEFPLSLDPYFLLFYNLAISVATVRRLKNLGEDCEYVFDDQSALGDTTAGYWETVKASLSDVLRPWIGQKPIHQNDHVVLPLQAADLYAWHWRRLAMDPPGAMPGPALLALRGVEPIERTISQTHLDGTVDAIIQAWSEGFGA